MPHRAAKSPLLSGRTASLFAVAVLISSALCLIATSPAWLTLVIDDRGDWPANAEVAYGGISAILSSLALFGIAGSLLLQQRQAKIDQIAAERQRHFDIVSLSLNDPELLSAILPQAGDRANLRQEVYINLLVGHWMTTWEMGGMTDNNVRDDAARLFMGSVARQWWRRVRSTWADTALTSAPRFTRIIDEAWRKAEGSDASRDGNP